jgi:hypothetical protein
MGKTGVRSTNRSGPNLFLWEFRCDLSGNLRKSSDIREQLMIIAWFRSSASGPVFFCVRSIAARGVKDRKNG